MKKTLLNIGLLFVLLVGCSDRSYKGYTDPVEEEDYPDEPVPVMMAVGDPSYSILTRGAGAFDPIQVDSGAWKSAIFNIYAFNRDVNTDFRVTWESAANKDNDICLVDGTLDSSDSNGGKPARMNKGDYSFLEWVGAPINIYYNTLHPNMAYDFYAYYVDNLNIPDGDITREAHRIFFNVQIDGSQDLMSSVAELTAKQQNAIDTKFFGDNKTKLENSLYSAYSANRGFNPMFSFKHHLTRFKFNIYPGEPASDSVYVDSICIVSRTKGVFTVVSNDISKMGVDFSGDHTKDSLYLKERGGGNLKQLYYRAPYEFKDDEEYASKDVYDRKPVLVGESLLVAPENSYKFVVYLRQVYGEGRESKFYRTEYTFSLSKKDNIVSTGFLPGKEYLVRIAIFGAQEVKVQVVTTDKWGDGGNVDVNPDDIFEY